MWAEYRVNLINITADGTHMTQVTKIMYYTIRLLGSTAEEYTPN
jgi:hypothetical protein